MTLLDTAAAAFRRTSRAALYSTHLPKLVASQRFKNKPDVCFVWVPKAAGTSVYQWLAAELSMLKLKETVAARGGFPQRGPVTFGHMDYARLLDLGWVTNGFHERAYKFAFVRNPYDRALSLYFYLVKRQKVRGSFTQFLRDVRRGVEPIGLYNSKGLSQCNPQHMWLFDKTGRSLVDDIFRVEDIDAETGKIAAKFSLQQFKIHTNRTTRTPDAEQWLANRENQELIGTIYAKDFELFSYNP